MKVRLGSVRWPSLLLVGCSVLVISYVEGTEPMVTFDGYSILQSNISLIIYDVGSACKCKALCNAKPSCRGVTIHDNDNGYLNCHLSDDIQLRFGLLQKNSKTITLLKGDIHGCDYPYEDLRGVGCINYLRIPLTFNAARSHCQNEHGDLFIMEDDDDIDVFQAYLTAYGAGLHFRIYVGVKGELWLDGRRVTSWGPNQPLVKKGADMYCGQISPAGELYEISCDMTRYFICEKPWL